MQELRTGRIYDAQQTGKTAALNEVGIGAGWRKNWRDADADVDAERDAAAEAIKDAKVNNEKHKARRVATLTSLFWWLILAFVAVAVTVVSELLVQHLSSPHHHQPRLAGQSLAGLSLLGSVCLATHVGGSTAKLSIQPDMDHSTEYRLQSLEHVHSLFLSRNLTSPGCSKLCHTAHAHN